MNNPTTRQQWIYDELIKQPALSYVDCFTGYSQKFTKSNKTFSLDWKAAKARHEEYQSKANAEKEKVAIAGEVEALKSGIKSKTERVLALQGIADGLLETLTSGMTTVTFMTQVGKPIDFERKIDISERTALSKAYKDVQAEISKIQGDYAPKKLDIDSKVAGVDFFVIEGYNDKGV